MRIGKHLNFGKASKVIKAAQQDMKKKPASVSNLDAKRQQKNGGKR